MRQCAGAGVEIYSARMRVRAPSPLLRPFVKVLWVSERDDTALPPGARERVLPTGCMHLVFRLSDHPVRIYDSVDDGTGRDLSHAVVGGARATYYVRDTSPASRSIGAQFYAGAAELLLGVPADELADRHTPLEDLWGRSAQRARERLLEAGSPERQLAVFESLLASRLPRLRAMHPAVAEALQRFVHTQNVSDVARASGYSHRRFITLFNRSVGLTPKVYCRVVRFQHALERLASEPAASFADIALDAGYSDQAHFTRDFREFAGVAPGQYRAIAPAQTNHIPLIQPPR
jgi:AraC-like DNA-binding protein